MVVALENDALDEPDSVVTLTVLPGDGYTVGAASSQQATVQDDDFSTAPQHSDTNELLPEVNLARVNGIDFVESDGEIVFSVRRKVNENRSGEETLAVLYHPMTVYLEVRDEGDKLAGPLPTSVTISDTRGPDWCA